MMARGAVSGAFQSKKQLQADKMQALQKPAGSAVKSQAEAQQKQKPKEA